ncbi:MAG TPA: hypothetical protein P5133_11130, partial [Spirochaetia bacterium]|nr:hypothetical protein [Spirochaetia bacterium]
MSEARALSRAAPPRAPTQADWSDALLTSGSEALIGAVRNYLGPVKTPYDKRELVRRLEAFLRREETRASLLGLLDGLDARILGTSLAVGPLPEPELKELFLGELPLFELGLRLSNLLDRLLLFRYAEGGRRLVAVNPLLAGELAARLADPAWVFGVPGARGRAADEGRACGAPAAVALFSFLFHAPASIRKGGGLTKRASERAGALFRGLFPGEAREEALGSLARALARIGALRSEGELWAADRAAFASLLEEWGEELPFLLAAALARSLELSRGGGAAAGAAAGLREEGGGGEEAGEEAGAGLAAAEALARLLSHALSSLPEGFAFPRPALARWLRVAARLEGRPELLGDPYLAIAALESLGLLSALPSAEGGAALVSRLGARSDAASPGVSSPGESSPGVSSPGVSSPRLVAEGDHALHLMPEAALADRLLVGCAARPVALGKVWSFELDRETARAAFASGLVAAEIRSRLEGMAARPLPQSLAFSLAAWEEEYRSLRLYRGLVLVADERQRPLVEQGIGSGALPAERLAAGVYFLSAEGPEEAAAQLRRAGIEPPPEVLHAAVAAPRRAPRPRRPGSLDADAAPGRAVPFPFAAEGRGGGSSPAAQPLDPEPRLAELRGILASSGRATEEAKELGERIGRRLVLTAEQIARSDPRPERMEAGGLDYLGKVRVVERSLRSPGDRLEVLYRLPGEEPSRVLLRPVRLDKTDKGLVLEAEDLGTG